MKKLPLFLLCLILSNVRLIAQSNFQRIYGGFSHERGHAVIVTHDGGLAIAGYTNSFGAGNYDIFLLKLDVNGVIEWQKTYGSALDEFGYSIVLTQNPDSSFVVTGTGRGNGVRVSDFYLFKTDPSGNLLWANYYDSGPLVNSGDHGRGLISSSNGDIIVVGSDDADQFGSNDGLVIRVDRDGNLIWKNVFGSSANDHLLDGIELPSGNLLLTGSSQSFGPGGTAGYLLKLKSDGSLISAKTYGISDIEYYHGCDGTDDHSLIAVGSTTSVGAGDFDVLLSRIDSSGNLQWSRTFGGPGEEWGVSVKTLPDKAGFIILAFTDSFGNGERDILIIRTDGNGALIWAKTFGTAGFESVDIWANATLCLTDDNSFLFTGWSDSLSFNGEDILLVKSDAAGSNLCASVDVFTTSPDLESIAIEPGSASPGMYVSHTPEEITSGFLSKEICQCIADCEKCERLIVHYDLNSCYSDLNDGSNMDYSEFTPAYPNTSSSATITATHIDRENPAMNKHSCTPGVDNSPAMCVSSLNSCTYDAGNDQSVIFELTIVPPPDSGIQITSLRFYEKAPVMFNWINGASGINNYPTLYGIRVLKNGIEIFRKEGIPTTLDVWAKDSIEFFANADFVATEATTFRFELLAYCLIGNGALVTAWDLDEIKVSMSCDPVLGSGNIITGVVRNPNGTPMSNIDIQVSEDNTFQVNLSIVPTDIDGRYTFKNNAQEGSLYLRGYHNSDFLNGVSTLDLIHIQKHLLGLKTFTSSYQLLAADANRSNSVSALDIHQLRLLILGRNDELPNNTSWRFFHTQQELELNDPWHCDEILEIPEFDFDVASAHFVGVKTGDVTFDARSSVSDLAIQYRSNENLNLAIEDRLVRPGELLFIDILSNQAIELSGLQLALHVNGLDIVDVVAMQIPLSQEDSYLNEEGLLSLSWGQIAPISISPADVLLQLVAVSAETGLLSAMLHLEPHTVLPEAYHGLNLDLSKISFQFTSSAAHGFVNESPDVEIYPNPFTELITVSTNLRSQGMVEISFFDATGKRLFSSSQFMKSGFHKLEIPSGLIHCSDKLIFCHVVTPDDIVVKKLMMLK